MDTWTSVDFVDDGVRKIQQVSQESRQQSKTPRDQLSEKCYPIRDSQFFHVVRRRHLRRTRASVPPVRT